MDSDVNIDQRLAEAVRIALRDFGDGILAEDRLMGILKDYHGFGDFPQGEFIVRTLIADGTLSHLYHTGLNPDVILSDHLCQLKARINRKYGFSLSFIHRVLLSFIFGMGYEPLQFPKESIEEKTSRQNPCPPGRRPQAPPPTSNSNSPKPHAGKPNMNSNIRFSIKWALIIFIFLPIAVSFLAYNGISNYKRYHQPEATNQSVTKGQMDIMMDTIVTAPDDTLYTPKRKSRPYPKGRWRESTGHDDYESDYDDGYEEGRYGRSRMPRSYGRDDAYETGYEDGLTSRTDNKDHSSDNTTSSLKNVRRSTSTRPRPRAR